MYRILSFFVLIGLTVAVSASGFELVTEKVTDSVYALVGEIGPRSI